MDLKAGAFSGGMPSAPYINYLKIKPGVQQCQAQGLVQVSTELGCVGITNENFWLDGSRALYLVLIYSPFKSYG